MHSQGWLAMFLADKYVDIGLGGLRRHKDFITHAKGGSIKVRGLLNLW